MEGKKLIGPFGIGDGVLRSTAKQSVGVLGSEHAWAYLVVVLTIPVLLGDAVKQHPLVTIAICTAIAACVTWAIFP